MPVPFKVKAVYEYRSEEPDDLNFDNGQIITVTEEDDADWYTGEYTNAQGQAVEGIFPRNFVEKYEPAIPTRPARGPKKAPPPEAVSEPVQEPEAPSDPPVVPAAVPPSAHEPSREAEVEPPRELTDPTSAPAPASKPEPQPQSPPPAVGESKPPPAKKPPPVVEKPSSFKDRIAAFNKPAAAPVAPFKPSGSGGTGFIKKPFVAPPPSRNAYVPPPRDPPPQKVYRREEEQEHERAEPEPVAESRPPVTSETTAPDEDQPKPTSLKDRIALLQQQQQEAAQRQADSARKKEKPKRPSKPPRTESSEAPVADPDDGAHLERVSTDRSSRGPELHEDEPEVRRSIDEHRVAPAPQLPSRELVSDTNDADDSGAADTEDPHDISTEEERPRPRSIKSPPIAPAKPEPAAEEEEDEEETEEEEDPEVRRKRELRERMAKMSGGMGMMGMFGAGAPAAPPKRSKSTREEKHEEPPQHEEAETQQAPPVPIMAMPGMSNKPMQPSAPMQESEGLDEDTAEPTPLATEDVESGQGDYISQRPSRKSTDISQPLSPQDRAPPPLPEDRPEPLQSPGARSVPPPPPPTRHDTQPSHFQGRYESDEDETEVASPSSAPKPPSLPPAAPPRAVPPPPPVRTDSSDDGPRTAPPVPMSPTSPQSRAPPPPPPGLPPRRTPTQSSLHPSAQEESEEEVTEYEGDYDTDIASGAKHKAALKSHQRVPSYDDGALSDDGARQPISPQARTVPPIPITAPRDVPLPPLQTAPRPRESVESPRAAPPPVPFPQAAPRPRESVDFPRAAPPPVPQPQSPVERDDYDPYRYSAGPLSGPPIMTSSMRKQTEEFDNDYTEPPRIQQPPERAAPPPPPSERAVPPPPAAAPAYHEPDPASMSGGLSAPKRSTELGRSNTVSRRSTDVSRPSMDHGFIAADVDLAQGSMWWTQENNPPPSLRNRNDVLWEIESSTTQKRGGRASVSRDVYVLYQDYSQTTINATFDASEPSHVAFEQNHERPPNPPRKDQLENAWESFGVQIAKGAEKALGSTIGEGTAQEFVLSLIRPMAPALLPIGTRAYGALVYANLANASTQQFDEIRAGDIMTFRNAKFAGHKGGLHQKYSQDVPQHVAVVIDWDGTKKKIRVWEQGNQEKGKRAKVRDESYRVLDLKSGEVRVWRVMPRSYVNWGTA